MSEETNGRNSSVKGVYSAEDVRDMLRQKAKELGSQKALAAACRVSGQFLSDIIIGKREPSGKPLEYLGLRRTVRYEPNAAVSRGAEENEAERRR